MRMLGPWIRDNPALPWGALFIALCLIVTQDGGTNAMSRWAAMRAITEGHTLSINNYRDWTVDWARAPGGDYYSNKAPGPVFLSLPLFALTEALALPLQIHQRDENGRVPQPAYWQHIAVLLFLQILPFFFLVLLCVRRLGELGAGPAAQHFFALAAFFGNTAAVYMNSHFGHGIASLLFLGALLSWLDRRLPLSGLLLSLSLLSDYGVAFALPFFLAATIWRERGLKGAFTIGIGALPTAVIWIWYHWSVFGSPFATANQFTNPTQNVELEGHMSLWGQYAPLPSLVILGRLLFGPERGVLFTQPWLFGAVALPFLRGGPRGLALLAAGSLAGLFWMNGGFGGWQGGLCVGPRYPSVVYPATALAIASSWNLLAPWLRGALWAALSVALAFRALIFPFSNLVPSENLWAYHWRLASGGEHTGTTALRFALLIFLSGLAAWWLKQRGGLRGKGMFISGKAV